MRRDTPAARAAEYVEDLLGEIGSLRDDLHRLDRDLARVQRQWVTVRQDGYLFGGHKEAG